MTSAALCSEQARTGDTEGPRARHVDRGRGTWTEGPVCGLGTESLPYRVPLTAQDHSSYSSSITQEISCCFKQRTLDTGGAGERWMGNISTGSQWRKTHPVTANVLGPLQGKGSLRRGRQSRTSESQGPEPCPRPAGRTGSFRARPPSLFPGRGLQDLLLSSLQAQPCTCYLAPRGCRWVQRGPVPVQFPSSHHKAGPEGRLLTREAGSEEDSIV